MTTYELLLFGHIAAGVIWLGAGFVVLLLVLGAARDGDRVREAGYHRDVGWLAPRLFIPASLSTLVFGVLLVIDGNWDLQLWIVLAMIGWLVSFLLGILYFKPEGERIASLVEKHGPDNAEAGRRVGRLNIVDRVQVTILFLVLADMVFKPTGDDGTVIALGAAILAAAVAYGVVAAGRTAHPGGQTP